ncbi:MAG: serine/threonine protein kinase [Oscillospiraceae bacterium]|nr:serine/threonine protein kinase [Oscillospiraceae bacterium]
MYNETLPVYYKLENWDYSYTIDDVKGQGGFGITYSAHRSDGKHVAIKEYFPRQLNMQRSQDGSVQPTQGNERLFQGGMQSFLDEAKSLAKLRNISSVVEALSYFQANGTAYLVMEFIEGISLKNLLRTEGVVKAEEFLPKFKVLLEDIDKMHSSIGLLHRDIAPDNIMLTTDGRLKLIDFGSARSVENGKSMTVLLKPGFAPIEQYQSHGQGTYTDVYGACATLYYCLTGKVPPAAINRLDDDPIVPPNQYGAGLTERQQVVLLRGLAVQPPTAKTPGKNPRYRTMGMFIKEFPWNDKPIAPPPPPPPPPIDDHHETVIIGEHDDGHTTDNGSDTIVIPGKDETETGTGINGHNGTQNGGSQIGGQINGGTNSSRTSLNLVFVVVCAVLFILGVALMAGEVGAGLIFAIVGIVGTIFFSYRIYKNGQ